MAIGALATAAIVIAAIQFAPWKGTKAAQPAQAIAPTTTQPPPAAITQPSVPVNTPPQAAAEQRSAAEAPAHAVAEPQRSPVRASQPPPQSTQAQSVQVTAPAVQQPMQQPVQQPAQQPAQAAPPQPAVSRAELQQIRETLVMLNTRASGIHSSLQTMQRSQAASGLNLSSRFTEPSGLMDSYLQGARDALNASDPASAKDMMDKAERQVGILEKLLNR
jgi:hypothetical protein